MGNTGRDEGHDVPWGGLGDRVRLCTPRPGSLAIRRIEEEISDITRLVDGKSFESADEVNEYLKSLTRAGRPVPKSLPLTPLQAAQDIIYSAAGTSSKAKRLKLARKALEKSPDCADAYVILAQGERSVAERLRLFEDGVAAGERALRQAGTDLDEPSKGEMWSIGARPYMRARLGLAECLWEMDRKDEAVTHYRDLLRLNPDDNQGVRQVLINALLDLGRLGEARALLKEYSDDVSVDWFYARAFMLWAESGDGRQARMEMRRAFCMNAFVPGYLSGRLSLPRTIPADIGLGDEDEAVAYAFAARGYWNGRPGALAWMDGALQEFTAGLPFPRGLDTVAGRRSIERAWVALRSGKPAKSPLMRAVSQHHYLGPLWVVGSGLATGRVKGPFVVGGVDLFAHIHLHGGLEEAAQRRDDDVGRALGEARGALLNAGVREHEAAHLLIEAYLDQVDLCLKTEGWSPFDSEAFARKMKYLAAVASGRAAGRSGDGRPERNEPCPCGSGAKFKKCCGRDDRWPSEPVMRVTREVQRRGRVNLPGSLGLMMLLDEGKHIDPRSVEGLHEDHPLVQVQNLRAVARRLRAWGYEYAAWLMVRGAVQIADEASSPDSPEGASGRTESVDAEVLRDLLGDAVELSRSAVGMEKEFEECATRLAELSRDPGEASRLWSEIAGLKWDHGDIQAARDAFKKALAMERPHPDALLEWARFLGDFGEHEEAREAYARLIDSIQRGPSIVGAGADPVIRDILADALDELDRIETKIEAERRRKAAGRPSSRRLI